MEQHTGLSRPAPRSAPRALGQKGGDLAGVREASTAAPVAAPSPTAHASIPLSSSSPSGPFSSGGVVDHRLAPRPRRSWDTTFLTNDVGDTETTDATAACRPQPDSRMPASTVETVGGKAGAGAGAGAGTGSAIPPDTNVPSTLSSLRPGGCTASDDDLTDTDEGVLARLAEFTEMARRTAAHNEELSQELAAEKRRGAHTNRKLEQSNMTSTELRESLALAQDTVMKLREHEIAWAESTASEMSLRAEMCALKDEFAEVSTSASVLRKRCDALQRENAELGDRLASIAEEKRQVETKARRLLRSDRYRGY
ncbi:unnamed protein product [Pylaiella littoralis]